MEQEGFTVWDGVNNPPPQPTKGRFSGGGLLQSTTSRAANEIRHTCKGLRRWLYVTFNIDINSGKKTFVSLIKIIMPRHNRVRHSALTDVVCPSVCPVPDPKSRTEWHSRLKIGRKKAWYGWSVTPLRRRKLTS